MALSPIVIASCALTPQQVIERGQQLSYKSDTTPTSTAWCMARNAEERDSIWRPTVRPLQTESARELLVQVVSGGATTVLVAHLTPTENGSDVSIWLTRRNLYEGREEFLEAVSDGCASKAH